MNDANLKLSPFVPVPWVCDAFIHEKFKGSSSYYIKIDKTPLGAFQGPIPAIPIYSPGMRNEYKKGDRVKALVVFSYNMDSDKFDSVARQYQTHILGLYEPEALIDVDIQNPLSEKADDRIVIKNENSQAGIAMTDNYELIETPGGAVSQTMKAFGAGIYKNSHTIRAQNFHRIVSHNDPEYFSREQFGMFSGKTLEDEASNILPEDILINYRRFVQQSRDPSKWVSTCEGAYAPWLGANNNSEAIVKGKEVLLTKIINNESSRITVEAGEPGSDFIMIRVDEVKLGELSAPTDSGATPGLIGNKCKISISDKGEIEIYAAGKGIPAANFNGFKMKVTEDGELTILAAKKITLSHGDVDGIINAIVMDPTAGVEIIAKSGFKVNGKKLLNENFLQWMNTNQASLVTSVLPPGSPCPLFPAALATFNVQSNLPDETGGFLTSSIPIPATGIIAQPDVFSTL